MSRLLTLLLLSSIVLTIGITSGCGQGALATPSNSNNISVSPSVASVSSGEQQQFVATLENGASKSVQWSVTSGSISSTGVLTAPATTTDMTLVVTAASLADPATSARATVRVKGKGKASGPVLAVSPASLKFSAVQGSVNPPAASLTITNSGGAVTNFASVSDQAWLQVSSATGTWPLAIQVSPSISGLSAGNYVGHITCTATGSTNSSVIVTVTLSVAAATPVQHQVNLSWNRSSSSNVVSYRIYRSNTSGGSYGLEASAITGQTYTDSSVQSGTTYYYVATDVDQQGQESAYSGEVRAVIP